MHRSAFDAESPREPTRRGPRRECPRRASTAAALAGWSDANREFQNTRPGPDGSSRQACSGPRSLRPDVPSPFRTLGTQSGSSLGHSVTPHMVLWLTNEQPECHTDQPETLMNLRFPEKRCCGEPGDSHADGEYYAPR